jgi:dual specificity tyrosine-phosphorylation-regulated kinase 2/3/4
MSAPPSPGIAHASFKNRDRPLPDVLDIPGDDSNAPSDGEDYQELSHSPFEVENVEQVPFLLTSIHFLVDLCLQFDVNGLVSEDTLLEEEEDQSQSRSASATSSLDPYYFGLHSETDDPVPSLPKLRLHLSTTPDFPRIPEPVTPGNPAMIDRRGLVGVGELATPRWARQDRSQVEPEIPVTEAETEGYDVIVPGGVEDDQPDSPWTIEAVDGESSEREDVRPLWLSLSRASFSELFRFLICNQVLGVYVQRLQ